MSDVHSDIGHVAARPFAWREMTETERKHADALYRVRHKLRPGFDRDFVIGLQGKTLISGKMAASLTSLTYRYRGII
jgi:hypothetical protein